MEFAGDVLLTVPRALDLARNATIMAVSRPQPNFGPGIGYGDTIVFRIKMLANFAALAVGASANASIHTPVDNESTAAAATRGARTRKVAGTAGAAGAAGAAGGPPTNSSAVFCKFAPKLVMELANQTSQPFQYSSGMIVNQVRQLASVLTILCLTPATAGASSCTST